MASGIPGPARWVRQEVGRADPAAGQSVLCASPRMASCPQRDPGGLVPTSQWPQVPSNPEPSPPDQPRVYLSLRTATSYRKSQWPGSQSSPATPRHQGLSRLYSRPRSKSTLQGFPSEVLSTCPQEPWQPLLLRLCKCVPHPCHTQSQACPGFTNHLCYGGPSGCSTHPSSPFRNNAAQA